MSPGLSPHVASKHANRGGAFKSMKWQIKWYCHLLEWHSCQKWTPQEFSWLQTETAPGSIPAFISTQMNRSKRVNPPGFGSAGLNKAGVNVPVYTCTAFWCLINIKTCRSNAETRPSGLCLIFSPVPEATCPHYYSPHPYAVFMQCRWNGKNRKIYSLKKWRSGELVFCEVEKLI